MTLATEVLLLPRTPETKSLKFGRPEAELTSLVDSLALREGANPSEWPTLTTYRFTRPQEPTFAEVETLSLCCVLQGRKVVQLEGQEWRYDPMRYFVLTRGNQFTAQILDGTPDRPFLSFVLQIDPTLVQRVAADLPERAPRSRRSGAAGEQEPAAYVAEFDGEIVDALTRFVRAVAARADRRLASLYLQEVVFRLMDANQRNRLLRGTAEESDADPVKVAMRYIQQNLGRGITVTEIARHVNMSTSTFAHMFRSTTGTSPYQYVTQLRLDRAKVLLQRQNLAVGEVARELGYCSLPHFSTEFRRRFGVCPRTYVKTVRAEKLDALVD